MSDLLIEPGKVAPTRQSSPARQHGREDKRLDQIQVLRALAALLVVFNHSMSCYPLFRSGYGLLEPFGSLMGRFGVDIFFLISGFIMVYTNMGTFGAPGAWAKFIEKRVTRIAPMYGSRRS